MIFYCGAPHLPSRQTCYNYFGALHLSTNFNIRCVRWELCLFSPSLKVVSISSWVCFYSPMSVSPQSSTHPLSLSHYFDIILTHFNLFLSQKNIKRLIIRTNNQKPSYFVYFLFFCTINFTQKASLPFVRLVTALA